MSSMNQAMHDYPLSYIPATPSVPYSAMPVMQSDMYPAVFCTFYPSVPFNLSENQTPQSNKFYNIKPSKQFEVKHPEYNLYGAGYPNRPVRMNTNFSLPHMESFPPRINDSIASSDCSIQDSTLETLTDSCEGEVGFGYFGVDGCWYPNLPYHDTKEQSEEQGFTNCEITAEINPPTRLTMPKPLMEFYNYYQRLDLPSSTLGRPHLIPTLPTDGNIHLEELWKAHMKLLFRNFAHKWTLQPFHADTLSTGRTWHTFRDLAKVRFYCQRCMDGWTSMFGVVIFSYAWNPGMTSGEIRYQVSGQKCGRCNPDTFELPLWYPEEAQKVVTNLYYEIAAQMYGLQTPQQIRSRRLGQPINHHNKDLCQGCSQGLCKREGQFDSSMFSDDNLAHSSPCGSPVDQPGNEDGAGFLVPPEPSLLAGNTGESQPSFAYSLDPAANVSYTASLPCCEGTTSYPYVTGQTSSAETLSPSYLPPFAIVYPYNGV